MYFRNTQTIKVFSDQEVYIRSYYAYCIFKALKEYQLESDHLSMIMAFATRLNKLERLSEILNAHIICLVSDGKLTHVSQDDEENTWHFAMRKKFVWHFYEDEKSYDRFGGQIQSETQANLWRAVYAGGLETLLRIYVQTFYNDYISDPEKEASVPEQLIKSVTSINLCKFLLKSNALTKKQVLCLQHLFRFLLQKNFPMHSVCCRTQILIYSDSSA